MQCESLPAVDVVLDIYKLETEAVEEVEADHSYSRKRSRREAFANAMEYETFRYYEESLKGR